MKQEHKESIHKKCVGVMAKYPNLFPISNMITEYWNANDVTEVEREFAIKHSLETTIGLGTIVEETYRSYETFHFSLKGEHEFIRMENMTVISILLSYVQKYPDKKDIDAYQNMLITENLK